MNFTTKEDIEDMTWPNMVFVPSIAYDNLLIENSFEPTPFFNWIQKSSKEWNSDPFYKDLDAPFLPLGMTVYIGELYISGPPPDFDFERWAPHAMIVTLFASDCSIPEDEVHSSATMMTAQMLLGAE